MLPIDAILPDLKAALERTTTLLLQAPPGAGKTTRVPAALLDAPWRGDGKILKVDKEVNPSMAGQDLVADLQALGVG